MIRPLYKALEPFMEVKSGYGYQGVIQYDDAEDKIQCHVCGKWFKDLGAHVHVHNIKASEYKIEYGLTLRTPLCGVAKSKKLSQVHKQRYDSGLIKQLVHFGPKKKADYNKMRAKPGQSMREKNKHGLCDLQMATRYEVVKSIVGGHPSQKELIKHDHSLWAAIRRRFGTINNYRISINAETVSVDGGWGTPQIELIAALRKFYQETKKIPIPEDMPNYKWKIYRAFGSWTSALRTAGIK